MRIATFNVNGITGRLPRLLEWLAETQPDIVCLQELKAPQERFPRAEIELAGYGAIWHGQKAWNGAAILAKGAAPIETRRGLAGDPDDVQSRYIEAAAGGLVVGCQPRQRGFLGRRPPRSSQGHIIRLSYRLGSSPA